MKKYWNLIPFIITTLLVLIICIQKFNAGDSVFLNQYTAFNNYLIFKSSSEHLLNAQDLYVLYPAEHGDLFKYSPTFAWLFIPFSYLPNFVGLVLWSLLNSIPLLYALYLLAHQKINEFLPIFFIMAIEMATALHSFQSNGLVSFLLLAFYLALLHRKFFWSGIFLALSVYIKLFGGLAILLVFLFPDWKKHIFSFAIWMFIFFFLPLLSIDIHSLLAQYKSWYHLLKNDPSHELNYSLATVIHKYSPANANIPNLFIMLSGFVILLSVILAALKKKKSPTFFYLISSFILMWFVLFNHKSESPTYIIGMVGVALLWIPLHRNFIFRICMGFAVLLVSLSATDLFPAEFRSQVLMPSQVKAIGLIPIFVYAWILILFSNFSNSDA